ncbi:Secreted and surface protein [Methanocella conradii HZ254]|uniref:Secreted and surface protein n=1 Tax=Methanocella conradii (strain DSM 24694 / JCM 17849 / CGMCC 1.5162 / HZ254) TaxID=1041930 RepID=H8I817_METCZ|nr:fasciclin domain-containing protein [Methanocella conradii]AFD00835.1 Secreted and surface protein [Methanocella conradii HZ254]MDI6897516.1 fasciclin domain-containing protein [Methanocella conradii]
MSEHGRAWLLNEMTACEVLSLEGGFNNFARALHLSSVGDMLETKGPYTVFAPPDDAFNASTIGLLMSAAKLDEMLRDFIVPGRYPLESLRRLQVIKAASGRYLTISCRDGVEVNGAKIAKPDVPYNKGIIHELLKL